jgi:cytochrome c2
MTMQQSQCKLLLILLILVVSCQQNSKQETTVKTITKSTTSSIHSDSLTIDLVALQKQGKLKNTAVVTVNDDPVYHGAKHYNAIALPELLTTYTTLKNLDMDKYQIIFECEDGYKPMMPLRKFLSAKSFLAVSDLDAPKGKLWSKVIKDGHEKKIAPFYLVYQGIPSNDNDFKWPYNIVKIHIALDSENVSLLFPKDDKKAQAGFELFKKNCITCHAINKIGGNMGPELNYPKSVTEYWDSKQLKAFIKNPASFRNGVKMPTPTHLTEKEIDDIVDYLTYMSGHKL